MANRRQASQRNGGTAMSRPRRRWKPPKTQPPPPPAPQPEPAPEPEVAAGPSPLANLRERQQAMEQAAQALTDKYATRKTGLALDRLVKEAGCGDYPRNLKRILTAKHQWTSSPGKSGDATEQLKPPVPGKTATASEAETNPKEPASQGEQAPASRETAPAAEAASAAKPARPAKKKSNQAKAKAKK